MSNPAHTFADIVNILPSYISSFISIITNPKEFVLRDRNPDNPTEGLAFIVISFLLSFFLITQDSNATIHAIVSELSLMLFALVISIFILRISWMAVGGKKPLRAYISVYCFYSGFIMVLLSALGAFINEIDNPNTLIVIFLIYYLFPPFWLLIAGWGAFREINGATRPRSFIAFIIFQTLGGLLILLYEWIKSS